MKVLFHQFLQKIPKPHDTSPLRPPKQISTEVNRWVPCVIVTCVCCHLFQNGWISAGGDIRTERVVGDVHAVLQSPEVEVDSELARITFNCFVICNLTGAPQRVSREHLAKISDCNLIFQVWLSNGTIQEQLNCTHPKGTYSYGHERRRDGRKMVHVYRLKKGKYFFR